MAGLAIVGGTPPRGATGCRGTPPDTDGSGAGDGRAAGAGGAEGGRPMTGGGAGGVAGLIGGGAWSEGVPAAATPSVAVFTVTETSPNVRVDPGATSMVVSVT